MEGWSKCTVEGANKLKKRRLIILLVVTALVVAGQKIESKAFSFSDWASDIKAKKQSEKENAKENKKEALTAGVDAFEGEETVLQNKGLVMKKRKDTYTLNCKQGNELRYTTEGKYIYFTGTINISPGTDFMGDIGLEIFDVEGNKLGYTTKVYEGSMQVYFCMYIGDKNEIIIRGTENLPENALLDVINPLFMTDEMGTKSTENFPVMRVADEVETKLSYEAFPSVFEGQEIMGKATTEEYAYEEYESGVRITKWNGNNEQASIPDTIQGKPVLEIGKRAFAGNRTMKSLSLPNTLQHIGQQAFSSCMFERVVLSDQLLSIGEQAFSGCTNLLALDIPQSVTFIGKAAFEDCNSMVTAQLPGGLQMLGEEAFARCESLKSGAIIPPNIKFVPKGLYRGCSNITEVTISEGTRRIGSESFSKTAISTLTLPSSVNRIEPRAFSDCKELAQVQLPTWLHVLGEGAFSGSEKLTAMVLPENLSKIGSNVFYGCSLLETLEIPPSVVELGGLSGISELNTVLIVYPDTAGYEYAQAHGCSFQLKE